MQQTIVAALSANPILTLFVVIGLGYLAGEVSLLGFRFGVAGVLFVGLALGSLSPAIALPEFVSTLGLIFFVLCCRHPLGAGVFRFLPAAGLS